MSGEVTGIVDGHIATSIVQLWRQHVSGEPGAIKEKPKLQRQRCKPSRDGSVMFHP